MSISRNKFVRPSQVVRPWCCFCGSTNSALPPWPYDRFPVCDECFEARYVAMSDSQVEPEPNQELLAAYQECSALTSELGMPSSAPWRRLRYTGADLAKIDARWQPFRVELFGDAPAWVDSLQPDLDDEAMERFFKMTPREWKRLPNAERRRFFPRFNHPTVYLPGDAPEIIRVWQGTVFHREVEGRIRFRWVPGREPDEDKNVTLTPCTDESEAERLLHSGRILLGTLVEVDGPRLGDTTYATRKQMRDD